MRLDDMRRSDNVEDLRGRRMRRTGAGIGVGTIIVLIVGYFMGVSPATLLGLLETAAPPAGTEVEQGTAPPANDPQTDFVRAVLGETEDVWTSVLREKGASGYPPPTLVLYSDSIDSACGLSGAAAGPFYCPGDQKLYIDLSFFNELEQRFGAPGDFARAYVIAHEVGHHVQALLGTTELVEKARRNSDPEVASATAAVGDDTLQRQAQGYVVPESFTHGSAEQRARWFRRGFEGGRLDACDTFRAAEL
jgi:predicted metalloprotease